MDQLKELSERFLKLPEYQQNQVIIEVERLLSSVEADVRDKQVAYHQKIGPSCPVCKSTNFRRNGRQQNQQVYLCKECGKQYRQSTGTFISWLKKPELLSTYIRHMLSGHSIRTCARLTEISIQTSFDWRHKILAAFGKINQDTNFSGIVESDDIYLPYSEKGNRFLTRPSRKRGKSLKKRKKQGISDEQVAIICTVDRQNNQSLHVAARGRISKKNIEKVLKGKISRRSILCTDSHRSFSAFTKVQKLTHVKINASEGQIIKGIYHVQHVNQKAADFKNWLTKFKGVSTKYLQNYLNWYSVKDIIMKSLLPAITAIELAVTAADAWEHFVLFRSGAYDI